MAQLSIRVGSPAVCSPASCFTAIKYHQGRAKERGKEGLGRKKGKGGREGGERRVGECGFFGKGEQERMGTVRKPGVEMKRSGAGIRKGCVTACREVVQKGARRTNSA